MNEPLRNTFRWSVSRDGTFLDCPRRYYFQYYGTWGGWESDAPERVRELYLLKQLKTRAMWIGTVVHDCIKRSLDNVARGVPVLTVDEILALTRDRMQQDFRESRAKAYRQNPKASCGLFEHEYELQVPDEKWREAADQVDHCLNTFYRSEVYRQLSSLRGDDFLEIERLADFDLDGIPVTIKLDCATREASRIIVWDWKTGRAEQVGHRYQMACYAFYASQKYGIPVGSVTTRRFDLMRDEIAEDTIGERSLGELLNYIRGSIKDMKALLQDPGNNVAAEDRFTKVARRDVCYRCNYLKVCRPEL